MTILFLKRRIPEIGNHLSRVQVDELAGPMGTEWSMGKTTCLFRVKGHYSILGLTTAFFWYYILIPFFFFL